MNLSVVKFLRAHGPCLTTDVSAHLVGTLGLSSDAARKRISRAIVRGEVKRLSYIKFPHRARFIYLQQHFGSKLYLDRLYSALQDKKTAYGLAFAALKARDGIVPTAHFPIVCGSPKKLSKHLSYENVLKYLCLTNLVKKSRLPSLGNCVTLTQEPYINDFIQSKVRSRLIAESVLLTAVKQWLQNLCFGSYNIIVTRDEVSIPTVGPFSWDLTAPSYLSFMVKENSEGAINPGFVVCDVLLGEPVTVDALSPFLYKCKTLKSLKNIAPCMQIFVSNSYMPEAFNLAKKQGIIPATTKNMFGSEVSECLSELISILSVAAKRSVDPEKFDRLFTNLRKIEGTYLQLRGAFFEFIVADLLRKTFSSNIRMNRIFRLANGKVTEADIIAIKENHSVWFVECKGYNPNSTISDCHVSRWLNHNIPILYKAARQHSDWSHLSIHFELWITCSISPEARKAIESIKSSVKKTKYTLDLRTGPEILKTCVMARDQGLTKVFQEHYMVQ